MNDTTPQTLNQFYWSVQLNELEATLELESDPTLVDTDPVMIAELISAIEFIKDTMERDVELPEEDRALYEKLYASR